MDLEAHWSAKIRPTATFHIDKDVYEREFEKLLDKYPVPDDYADLILSQSQEKAKSGNNPKSKMINNLKTKQIDKF